MPIRTPTSTRGTQKGHPLEPNSRHVGFRRHKRAPLSRITSMKAQRATLPWSQLLPCRLEEARRATSSRLAWIVLAGIRLAGGRRPPLITHCSGGRPKVTCAGSLSIFAPAFRASAVLFQSFVIHPSLPETTQQKDICVQIPFGPPLAGGLHILRIPSWHPSFCVDHGRILDSACKKTFMQSESPL